MKNSSDPQPRTERVCLNGAARPAELRTCAGWVRAPDAIWGGSQTSTCTDEISKQTRSIIAHDHVTDRSEYTAYPSPGDPGGGSWEESTMTYVGACPVPMADEQPFLVVKPDGKVFDPFPATVCMVDALKTVAGVTAPKAGYIWDPGRGPLPFVRYTYPSRQERWATDITFTRGRDFVDDPDKVEFVTTLSGAYTPGQKPNDFGAERIARLWKARCGVDAGVDFE
jgi:hypothetical protein